MSDMRNNFFKKNSLISIALMGLTLLSAVPVKASDYISKNEPKTSNTQYGVSIAPDFYSLSYSVQIFDEKNAKYNTGSEDNDMGNIKEYTVAPFARYISKKGAVNTYNATIPTTVPDASEIGNSSETVGGKVGDWNIYNSFWNGKTATNRPYFLFPRDTRQADEVDKKEAERVEKYLVNSLNKALNWIVKQVGWNPGDESERIKDFFKLTGELANIKETEGFDFKGHTFEAQWQNQKNKSGTLTLINKKTGDKLEKLYYQINVYKDVSDDKEYKIRSGVENDSKLAKLNWNQVVYYGNASYIATGLNSMNQTYQVNSEKADLFERLLADLFNSVIDKLNTLLGAERFERLMLNDTDKYGWHGVMPNDWFEIAGVFFWLFQILAWIILLGAVVKLFTSNLISSMNTFGRVQLLEGVRDILLAAFMLAFIYPIFELLANFNELFINIVANLARSNERLLGSGGFMEGIATGNGLATALLGVLYFGLNIYFNAIYILRAVSVCLLFGLAPAFTVLYAFGGRFKALTLRFYREVVGNIFIGSFYAIAVTFYGMFTFEGNGNFQGALLSFVLLWGFIPMTKLFKQLTGIGESDFISQTASTTQNKVEGAAKKYIKDPAQRFAKGTAAGAIEAHQAIKGTKQYNNKIEKDVEKMNTAAGEKVCRLSDYDNGGAQAYTGAFVRGVGEAFGNKTLKQYGNDLINNSGTLAEMKMNTPAKPKLDNEQKGTAYKDTNINEKGHYEHTFDGEELKNAGILNTTMKDNNTKVEQTYSADYVKNKQDLFNRIQAGTNDSGLTKKDDRELLSQGVTGSRFHKDGTVTVSYSVGDKDIKGLRQDAGNLIVERGSSTTKATADITDQIDLLTDAASKISQSAEKSVNSGDKATRVLGDMETASKELNNSTNKMKPPVIPGM